jgi:hypothetical protein
VGRRARLALGRALVLGVLLAGANPKNLILTVGAAATRWCR